MEIEIRASDEQVRFFRREGYLVIERITTDEEVERMRIAYDHIFAERASWDEGSSFDLAGTDDNEATATLPQILGPGNYAPELRDTVFEANALIIGRQLLGDDAQAQGAHAILKPAQIGGATPWHQDEAYWGADKNHLALSVWMPLQEATPENGCMYFIPRSHEGEVMPHHHIDNDPRIRGLEVDEGFFDLSTAVMCPLPAGGATFHYCQTCHYTPPNTSHEPRRAIIQIIGVPQPPREVPRDFYWQRETDTARERR